MAKPLTITTSLDSCVAQMDLALQGNLFGEPETPAQTRAQNPAAAGDTSLDDTALAEDARARPRQRASAEPAEDAAPQR